MRNLGRDLADLKPAFPISIKWIGIESIDLCVPFKPIFEEDLDPVYMACKFSLYCSLDKHRRGAHISRFPEILIEESHSSPKSIFHFCKAIADNIRKSQKQEYGRIRLFCEHSIEKKSPIAQKPTLVPLLLGVDMMVSSSHLINEAFIEFDIITMCPCVLEMSSRVRANSGDRFVGSFSHTQRARLKLTVIDNGQIDYKKILEVAEEVSLLVSTTLKRPDELHLVRNAFSNPVFCEDIVRHALVAMKHRFEVSSSETSSLKLKATIRSHESIHPFSIVATGETRI